MVASTIKATLKSPHITNQNAQLLSPKACLPPLVLASPFPVKLVPVLGTQSGALWSRSTEGRGWRG